MTAAAGEQLATGPYKGLLPFEDTELDAVLFFGREREQEVISANLMASRLTVLYGASGVGKTSVLRAAVAHRLRRAARRNLAERGHPEHALAILDRWSDDPVGRLTDAVEASLAELFGDDAVPGVLGATLAGTLDDWTSGLDCDLLLIVDQTEEYFLYHPHEAGPGSFAEELPELVTRPGLRVNVLIAIREDAVAQLDRFKARIPNLFGNYLRLDHLDRDSARAAIVGPLDQFNRLSGEDPVGCEPELVDAVLDQTATGRLDLGEGGRGVAEGARELERIEAPYLQLVMQRLWEEERAAGSRTLRLEVLEGLGGAQEIVRGHLERALGELRPEQRDVAASVFHHLVTPSGTKIAHRTADLAEYADVQPDELLPVLATLGRERIVRTVDGAGEGDGSRYEIFHDVLADPVLVWRSERRLERERQEAERRHRRILIIAVAALIGLGAMAAVAVFALTQRSFALDQRSEARTAARHARARELAARSASVLTSDPATSLRLAVDAARLEPTAESEERLRTALIASNLRALYPGGGGPIVGADVTPDERRVVTVTAAGWVRVFTLAGRLLSSRRAPRGLTAAAFSTDGRLVATGGRDRTVRLWEVSGGSPILLLRQPRIVTSLAFSPDGGDLAVAAGDRAVRISHIPGGALLRTLVLARVARELVFSPDGRSLVTVGGQTSARVYDVAGGTLRFQLRHRGTVTRAVFSRNGQLIGTASMDKTARLWFAATGGPHKELSGHVGHVLDVAFSPRGTLVATTSTDATSRIWKAGSGEVIAPLFGHRNYVVDAEFSSTGNSIVTASLDRTARVYDAQKGKPQSALIGHRGAVLGATFTAGGGRVLTWSEDGTARLWDPQTQDDLVVLGRYGTPVRGAVFSPDGRLVAVATARGAFIIDSGTGRVVRRLRAGTPVEAVSFRPDGKILALGLGRRIAIVRAGTWSLVRTLRQAGAVSSVAFAPDGRRLATGAADRITRIWGLDGGLRRELRGHSGPVTDVAFSADGRRLATASEDRTARIWSVETGKTLRVLRGHRDVVTSVAFSPDGRRVVTASRDHKPRIWDVGTGRVVRRLIGHFGTVSDASFSPDGRWVLTAGPVTAGLWGASTDRPLLLHGPLEPMTSVSFDAAGRRILATSVEGTVRVFDCRLCGRNDVLVALARARLAPLERAVRH